MNRLRLEHGKPEILFSIILTQELEMTGCAPRAPADDI